MSKPVVIVGASMGGLRAAESLRRFGYQGAITAIGDETYAPYNRPPLSKEVLANEVTHSAVAFPLRAATEDVNWVLGTRAVSADLEHATVTDSDGVVHTYSALIIATGLRPRRLQVKNGSLSGRHAIRSLDDAMALRAELKPGARVVIVGAGFIGCETAATARKLGCEVTIVSPGAHPIARPLGSQLAQEIQRRHEAMGVKFRMKTNVKDFIGDKHIMGVILNDDTELACDVLIEAIGSHENTEWLEGNDLNLEAGVLTDSNLRASKSNGGVWENVFAIGDVARFPLLTFDEEPRRIEHWNIPTDTAKRVGQLLAARLSGAQNYHEMLNERFAPIPSFWSDQYDNHILAYGLLGLADEVKLLQGDISGDCVFGYYRNSKMVGVCGIGLRSVVQSFRSQFA